MRLAGKAGMSSVPDYDAVFVDTRNAAQVESELLLVALCRERRRSD